MSRAVLFDVDGVLVHGLHARPQLRRMWSAHLKDDLGVDEQTFAAGFIREGFARNVMVDRRSLVAELEDWLPKVGYACSPLSFIAYWLQRDSQLNQPLLAAIRQLRRAPDAGPFYVATNQEHLRAMHLWSTLGLQHIFDDIFYAARLGAMKPDRAFFEAITRRLGPHEERPLLFDDSPEVVDAASAYGWEAAVYEQLGDFTGHPWIAARLPARAAPPDAGTATLPIRRGRSAAAIRLRRHEGWRTRQRPLPRRDDRASEVLRAGLAPGFRISGGRGRDTPPSPAHGKRRAISDV